MAAAEADARLITGKRSWAPAGLWVISLFCFLYVGLLYMIASNPDVRAFGFGTIAELQQKSALIFVLLFFAALAVEHNAPEGRPAPARSSAPSAGGPRPATQAPRTGAQVSLQDPHARPGATPPMSIPRIFPDQLEGGWQRWKFPSERTGGIYIDTDVVVDDVASDAPDAPDASDGSDGSDGPDDSAASPDEGRGLHILRVRDEVARVCVRCDLVNHCHSKVRTLITKQEMMANSDCVAGLRQIAKAKIAAREAARAAATAAAPAAGAPAAAGEAPAEAPMAAAGPGPAPPPEAAPGPAPAPAPGPAPDPPEGGPDRPAD